MDCQEFKQILIKQCGLSSDQLVVAGVSGGPDSLCMLYLLIQCHFPVHVVHINHRLRDEAGQEAEFVRTFCAQHSIPCDIVVGDVKTFSQSKKFTIEEGARVFRYQVLFSKAAELNAQAVLVAHNADDQVETVLMHLLRGSGIGGLKGMQPRADFNTWSTSIPLVRPLLGFRRDEIVSFCRENGLDPRTDPSNQDFRYMRNRIRGELIPFLQTYNPQIKKRMTQLSKVAGLEDDFLTRQVDQTWRKCLVMETDRFLLLNAERLADAHAAILHRLLRRCLMHLEPDIRDVDYSVVHCIADFITKRKGTNHLRLVSDFEIHKISGHQILFCHLNDPLDELWPQIIQTNPPRQILIPGETTLRGGWKLRANLQNPPFQPNTNPSFAQIDAERTGSLFLDSFTPGDRFAPYGLNGKMIKLGDFWTNAKLPEKARKAWPLLRNDNGDIIWVVGMQISDSVRVTNQTRQLLCLELAPPNQPGNSPAN